jgi:hypothetical protein
LYPLPSAGANPILHAAHVEALCHAELNRFRARIECKTCIKPHIEWFKVSPDDVALEQVIAVVRKWWWWMGTCPYQKDPETGWGLKKEELKKVLKFDGFVIQRYRGSRSIRYSFGSQYRQSRRPASQSESLIRVCNFSYMYSTVR